MSEMENKKRVALQILEFLSSSSSSSSDEDEFCDTGSKIPKIENFIEVVHNLKDKDVSWKYVSYIFYIHISLTWSNK